MKPMIKYRGGKSKEIPYIKWYVPRFTGRYIEPFFGGGALFFYLEPRKAIINDINAKLMAFYRGVRDNYPTLRKELDEVGSIYMSNRNDFDMLKVRHPEERVEDKNEAFYYKLRAMFNGTIEKEYSDALLYFYINKTAYSGMIRYNTHGEFNVPFGRYAHLNTKSVTLSHSRLLQRAEIYDRSYASIFNMCHDDDFMFLDPPYDCIFSDYGNEEYKEGFNEDSHRQLAQDFANLSCKTLMVISKTQLTEELYRKFIIGQYQKSYAVNIRNRFKSAATHIIVSNYRKQWDNVLLSNSVYGYEEAEASQLQLFETRQSYGSNK